MKILPIGAELFLANLGPGGRTERHDESNSRL